jgi:hypothetical protein
MTLDNIPDMGLRYRIDTAGGLRTLYEPEQYITGKLYVVVNP